MDLGVTMSREVFEDKLDHANDGRSAEATWSTRRLPRRLTPGWTNRLFVAVDGAWRGWFPLSGEALWNPEDGAAPYTLIFDTRGWRPLASSSASGFRGWRYLASAPGDLESRANQARLR